MTHPAILEAAARALQEVGFYDNEARAVARTTLSVVTPLIRAAALEEAAVVAEDEFPSPCAAKIRALKEQP